MSSSYFELSFKWIVFDGDLLRASGLRVTRDAEKGMPDGQHQMNDEGYVHQLAMLKIEHRDLDDAIDALRARGAIDQLQIARLKKKKLALKDRIRQLEDQLVPDIIA